MNKYAQFGAWIAKIADNDLLHLNAMVNPTTTPAYLRAHNPPPADLIGNRPVSQRTIQDLNTDPAYGESWRNRMRSNVSAPYEYGVPVGFDNHMLDYRTNVRSLNSPIRSPTGFYWNLRPNSSIGAVDQVPEGNTIDHSRWRRPGTWPDVQSHIAGGIAKGSYRRPDNPIVE